jgi:hypothetical protein
MLATLSNFTRSLYKAYNETNSTALWESAKNSTAAVVNSIIESNQISENTSTPSLTEQTIIAVSTETTKILELSELGKEILNIPKSTVLQTELAKINKAKLVLFKKIGKAWRTVMHNGLVLYNKTNTYIHHPEQIGEDARYAGEVIANKTGEITDASFKKLQYLTGVTPGVCYTPPKNATIDEACIDPIIDCGIHKLVGDGWTCCTYPRQCYPAITRTVYPMWTNAIDSLKNLSLASMQAAASASYALGQTSLSSLFSVYPFTNQTLLPAQMKSSIQDLATSAGITTLSFLSYFGLPAFGMKQNQLTRSFPVGAAIGATASAFWGTNPVFGAIKGIIAQTGLDTFITFPLERLYLGYQKNDGLKQAVGRFGNALPLATVIATTVGLFGLGFTELAMPYSNAIDLITSPSYLCLFPVTFLYGISTWTQTVINTATPNLLLPAVAFASLLPISSYIAPNITSSISNMTSSLASRITPVDPLTQSYAAKITGTLIALLGAGIFMRHQNPRLF